MNGHLGYLIKLPGALGPSGTTRGSAVGEGFL
jgi:hypothetical protein